MIGPTSVFRRLPAGLNRKQTLFLDGIRHAAEIADISLSRLRTTLTSIAGGVHAGATASPMQIAEAYLDAWAFVDAVDRFRLLLTQMPGTTPVDPPSGVASFRDAAAPFRDLRNVADHLSQRIDYVIANEGQALGSLAWATVIDLANQQVLCCTIVPGTIATGQAYVVNPAGRVFPGPTAAIHLSAGEYRACLDDIVPLMQRNIAMIEEQLEEQFAARGVSANHAGSDIVIGVLVGPTPASPQDPGAA